MTNNLSRAELIAAIEAADALEKQHRYNKISQYFPDQGPYSRDKYPKQMELMRAGKTHNKRAFIGGNGSGKTLWLAYETYLHLSGQYPSWWDGHRYSRPIDACLASINYKALTAGLQRILFGGVGDETFGTGIIPRDAMCDPKGNLTKKMASGGGDAVGSVSVKHYTNGIFDGYSTCEFMTYDMGWGAFQGANRDWIGGDEEPREGKIAAECVARLRGKDGGPDGHLLWAFTPTDGFREVYKSFTINGRLPEDGVFPNDPSRFLVRVGWSSAPHLSEAWKQSAINEWKQTDPNNIEARTEGYAAMGSGRIYPIDESFVVVPSQKVPSYWKCAYGFDPGWNYTAAVWIAEDPNTNIKYIYGEYQGSKVVDVLHVDAIKARGSWIKGGIDPHGAKHKRDDGTDKIDYLNTLGLDLIPATGDPTTIRSMILGMFMNGSLKIMDSCPGLIEDIRMFRYSSTDPNKPEKDQMDHRPDAMMYGIAVFPMIAESSAEIEDEKYPRRHTYSTGYDDGRNSLTGY